MQDRDICFSGGARGADLAWGALARRLDHRVMHFSFKTHRTKAPAAERVILSPAQLAEGHPHLRAAARALHRPFPPRTEYTRHLLERDWFEVKDAERLYAVASLTEHGQIAGGTAWAVAMFLARHGEEACVAFLYDQARKRWLEWRGAWEPIAAPPIPSGRWTGIGARELSRAGAAAIAALSEEN
jgi:hypothetical protein